MNDEMRQEQETSASKVYLVVNAKLNEESPDAIKAYTGNVIPLLKDAGGKNLKRGKLSHVINGKINYPLILFMEFDHEDAIKEVFASKAYQDLVPYRDKAFEEIDIYIFSDMQ